jgi:hypothetical protein
MKGGEDGHDTFNVAGIEDPVEEDVPDYMVNSLVDIDGGTGSNNLTIVGTGKLLALSGRCWQSVHNNFILAYLGTERNDRYVVKNGLIFGGGLSVKYTNIANLQVSGEAGDDESKCNFATTSFDLQFTLQFTLLPPGQKLLSYPRILVCSCPYMEEWGVTPLQSPQGRFLQLSAKI